MHSSPALFALPRQASFILCVPVRMQHTLCLGVTTSVPLHSTCCSAFKCLCCCFNNLPLKAGRHQSPVQVGLPVQAVGQNLSCTGFFAVKKMTLPLAPLAVQFRQGKVGTDMENSVEEGKDADYFQNGKIVAPEIQQGVSRSVALRQKAP